MLLHFLLLITQSVVTQAVCVDGIVNPTNLLFFSCLKMCLIQNCATTVADTDAVAIAQFCISYNYMVLQMLLLWLLFAGDLSSAAE